MQWPSVSSCQNTQHTHSVADSAHIYLLSVKSINEEQGGEVIYYFLNSDTAEIAQACLTISLSVMCLKFLG